MDIILKKRKNCLVVRLAGELDDHMAARLRRELKETLKEYPSFSLLLNMEGLSFIDSSGVGVILGRYREMTREKRDIMLCGLGSQVKRVLDLAGVLKIVPCFGSEEEALNQGRSCR